MKEQFKALLEQTMAEMGGTLQGSLDEVALYASERTAHLATVAGQPGFAEALIAERDSVALRAGLNVAADARAFDQRLLGLLQGGLAFGAAALAGLAGGPAAGAAVGGAVRGALEEGEGGG